MTTSASAPAGSFLRFLIVGGSIAMIYALVCTGLTTRAGLPPGPVSVAVWLALIPPAYACQRRFTFRTENPRRGAMALYALTQGMGVAIASTVAWAFAGHDAGRDFAVFLAGSALAAVASWLMNRLVVFAEPAR